MFRDKVLLITGGTGSFGYAVLDRFINTEIKEIRIFSRDEKKQDEMRNMIKNDKVKYYIGDVRDYESINYAMKGVDYVFHAAALKQVPSCEFYPIEALKTNVIGSNNVFNAAIENGIERVILLSTDKAVYPVNAMGMSKAMAEKIMIARARTAKEGETVFCATRYGNVMASRGSVIPLFINQIKKCKDLTITDPNMTRFLMSQEESVDLVIYAFEHGNQGDVFIEKAPASTILELANALREIFDSKCNYKIIGPRHGEKSYETLLTKEEYTKAIDCGNYYRIPCDNRDLNYEKYFTEGNDAIRNQKEYNSDNTNRVTAEELKEMLLKLPYIQEELKNKFMFKEAAITKELLE